MRIKWIQCEYCGNTYHRNMFHKTFHAGFSGVCYRCSMEGGTKPTRRPNPDDLEFDAFMKRQNSTLVIT